MNQEFKKKRMCVRVSKVWWNHLIARKLFMVVQL